MSCLKIGARQNMQKFQLVNKFLNSERCWHYL